MNWIKRKRKILFLISIKRKNINLKKTINYLFLMVHTQLFRDTNVYTYHMDINSSLCIALSLFFPCSFSISYLHF